MAYKFNPITGKMDIIYDASTSEKTYLVPAGSINGVSDAEGVITGTAQFTVPTDVDLTRPLKVFVDGAFSAVTTADVAGVKSMTLPVAPLLGAVVILYYWPTL